MSQIRREKPPKLGRDERLREFELTVYRIASIVFFILLLLRLLKHDLQNW